MSSSVCVRVQELLCKALAEGQEISPGKENLVDNMDSGNGGKKVNNERIQEHIESLSHSEF